MALDRYGVLNARAVERRREGATATPHYEIHAVAADGETIVSRSTSSPSRPRRSCSTCVDPHFGTRTAELARCAGCTALPSQPGGGGSTSSAATSSTGARCGRCRTTFRARTTTWATARPLRRARDGRPGRGVYAFGERWGPEPEPRQVLRVHPGQRRPRHPHEPGQRAPFGATTASGRTAGCSSLPGRAAGSASFSRSSPRPGTPTTSPATPSERPAPRPRAGRTRRADRRGAGQPDRSRARARDRPLLNASPDAVDLAGWRSPTG